MYFHRSSGTLEFRVFRETEGENSRAMLLERCVTIRLDAVCMYDINASQVHFTRRSRSPQSLGTIPELFQDLDRRIDL